MQEWVRTLSQRFGWWDVLDILIVAIIIYEVLKLIRGTARCRWLSERG